MRTNDYRLNYARLQFLIDQFDPNTSEDILHAIVDQLCQRWSPGPFLALAHLIKAKKNQDIPTQLNDYLATESPKHHEHLLKASYRDILNDMRPEFYRRDPAHLHALWGEAQAERINPLLNDRSQDGPTTQDGTHEGLTPAHYLAIFHPDSLTGHRYSPPQNQRYIWSTITNQSGLTVYDAYCPWISQQLMQGNTSQRFPTALRLFQENPRFMYQGTLNTDDVHRLLREAHPDDTPIDPNEWCRRLITKLEYLSDLIPNTTEPHHTPTIAQLLSYLNAWQTQTLNSLFSFEELLCAALFDETPARLQSPSDRHLKPSFDATLRGLPRWNTTPSSTPDDGHSFTLSHELLSEHLEEKAQWTFLLANPVPDESLYFLRQKLEQKPSGPSGQKQIDASDFLEALKTLDGHPDLPQLMDSICACDTLKLINLNHATAILLPASIQHLIPEDSKKRSRLQAQLLNVKRKSPLSTQKPQRPQVLLDSESIATDAIIFQKKEPHPSTDTHSVFKNIMHALTAAWRYLWRLFKLTTAWLQKRLSGPAPHILTSTHTTPEHPRPLSLEGAEVRRPTPNDQPSLLASEGTRPSSSFTIR